MRLVQYAMGLCLLVSTVVFGDEAQIRKSFSAAMPGLQLSSVEKSEIEGMYLVTTEAGEVLMVSSDGKYFLTGDLYTTEAGQVVNLTETRKKATIFAASNQGKIVFPANGDTKARIAVFTDIDCGYCVKLHRDIPKLNEMGIEVSYLAFPRAGVGSESYNKYVSAWCADDKLEALTAAKSGRQIPRKNCENPVESQYMLGKSMGIRGTPAIVPENGRMIPGYVEPQKLGEALGIL